MSISKIKDRPIYTSISFKTTPIPIVFWIFSANLEVPVLLKNGVLAAWMPCLCAKSFVVTIFHFLCNPTVNNVLIIF